jgi:ethanolamine utilization protein EutQ (cupin superfamily)
MGGFVRRAKLHGHCGGVSWAAAAGDLVFIPRDTPHNFTVTGQTAARYLLINSPPNFAAEVAEAPPAQALTLPPADA